MPRKKSKVGLLGLASLIYVMVAAGGFGCEDMVGAVGPGMTMLIFIVLPFVWSLPFGLVTAQLTSAYPVNGGMYTWTREVFGEKAGFASGWCYMAAGFVEPALFAALSANYLKEFLPFELDKFGSWMACVIIVLTLSAINLFGIKLISNLSIAVTLLMLIPFVFLLILAFTHIQYNPVTPFVTQDLPLWKAAGQGLLMGIWLNMGYEAISTMTGEIENGGKLIPKAIMIVIPFVSILYLIFVFPALASVGDWQNWSSEGPVSFIDAGMILGGKLLHAVFIAGAVISSLSMCCVYIGVYSRVASSMSEQGQFFRIFSKIHPRLGTPYMAIVALTIVSTVVSLIGCYGSFVKLVGVAAVLYAVPFFFTFAAAIKLRFRNASERKGLLKAKLFTGFVLIPMMIYGYGIFTDNRVLGFCLAATAVPAYLFFKFGYKGGRYWKTSAHNIDIINEINDRVVK